MHIGKENDQVHQVDGFPAESVVDIFPEEYIETDKSPISHPGEKDHHHFVSEPEVVNEGVRNEINERGTSGIDVCPAVIFRLRPVKIGYRVGCREPGKGVIDGSDKSMIPEQLHHQLY